VFPNGIAELISGIGYSVAATLVVCILFIPKFEKLYSNVELRFSEYESVNPVTMKLERIMRKWKMRRIVSMEPQHLVTFTDLCGRSYSDSMAECREEIKKWQLLHMEISEMDDLSQQSAGSLSFRKKPLPQIGERI
jgi:hypothetical protein